MKPPASYLVLQLGAERIPEVATAQRASWANRNGKRVSFVEGRKNSSSRARMRQCRIEGGRSFP